MGITSIAIVSLVSVRHETLKRIPKTLEEISDSESGRNRAITEMSVQAFLFMHQSALTF